MECGGGSGKGGEKNTTRSVAQVWRFFLSACYTLVHYVFVEQRERLTNTALPALFCAEAHRYEFIPLKKHPHFSTLGK
jgi:hypothetical protein